jgi:hypothetical protein
MEARLCFIGHGLMQNRSGLIIDARLTPVSGHAERLAALDMIEPVADRPVGVTLGAAQAVVVVERRWTADPDHFIERCRALPDLAVRRAGPFRPADAQDPDRMRIIEGALTGSPAGRQPVIVASGALPRLRR